MTTATTHKTHIRVNGRLHGHAAPTRTLAEIIGEHGLGVKSPRVRVNGEEKCGANTCAGVSGHKTLGEMGAKDVDISGDELLGPELEAVLDKQNEDEDDSF